MTAREERSAFDAAWVQVGLVLAMWALALLVENVAVTFVFRGEFAGGWETRASRRGVIPLALAGAVPFALAVTVIGRAARTHRGWLAGLAALAGAGLGWGVSYGRHMASLAVRVPFVVAVALGAGSAAWFGAPALARVARAHPRAVASIGALASAAMWWADGHVLPRLYLPFHVALFGLTLAAAALLTQALRPQPGDPTRAPAVLAGAALLAAGASLAYAPAAARLVAASDNLRVILVEHAPLAGRAVWLASRLAPPPADEASDPGFTRPGELPRALDWTGRDVVLITVDALRADHVSAYGYPRTTTPSIDAIAAAGARFDAAYCPTPHTSYSIASLMTGKYMRPLVAMGLGQDSDTWAALLRRYGYRTAAFFPPAVFFIDGEQFAQMHERGLDFEYRKEEFAAPDLRAKQVASYLASAPHEAPLFLWVHFFEPHEPYVAHPEHTFGAGTSDIDRYDSEIATADEGIGVILREVRASRPGAVVIVTADHGEEFGEHAGRYHGTTVYEEQVRVPLVIDGPGVATGPSAIPTVVQTIDLLPTVLSALGIPRPARLRGRDLGALLARSRAPAQADPGLAFAETDEYTLLAKGDARLICVRRAAACALYDRAKDPGETRDLTPSRPDEARALRRLLTGIASDHGRMEHGEEAAWPEALRRGIAGDADAAPDVAALLDDASPAIRAKAAEVTFDLHAPEAVPAMRRALARTSEGGEDDAVKRWCALALVRAGEAPTPLAADLARDADASWRRAAALAFAEQGDARGATDLAAWWGSEADRAGLSFTRSREILGALTRIHDRAAIPALIRSLSDVRLRSYVADTLGAIGDVPGGGGGGGGEHPARASLEDALATEAQVTTRVREARALLTLGGAAWTPGGAAPVHVEARLRVPRPRSASPNGAGALRLIVLTSAEGECRVSLAGAPLPPSEDAIAAHAFPLATPDAGAQLSPAAAGSLPVTVDAPAGVSAIFLVRTPGPD